MALPKIDIKELIEAGVHFGHQSRHWNPKMARFIYGTKNKVHIIDLRQTVAMLEDALKEIEVLASGGGKFLFVGTKRQAQDLIKETAEKTGQFYVNHRWLGGMLTNWKTISASIKKMKLNEKKLENTEDTDLTKKELLNLTREQEKLNATLGGIMDLNGKPSAIIVVDVPREKLAIAEAKTLGIPVFAICDTNANPDGIDYIIPANDDSYRSVALLLDLFSKAILSGFEKHVGMIEAKSSAKKEEKKAEEPKTEAPATVEKPAVEVVKKVAKKTTKTTEAKGE